MMVVVVVVVAVEGQATSGGVKDYGLRASRASLPGLIGDGWINSDGR